MTAPAASSGSSRADLWAVSGSSAIVMLGQGVVAPVLPLYAESFGVGLALVGLALSAFAFSRVFLNIPLGLAADRWGRRPLLVGGPIVVAAGMLGSALAPNIWVLMVLRVLAGAGSAMYMTAALVYLTDIATPANRARYVAANMAGMQLGHSIGPAVGGLIAEHFGLRAPFYFVACSALLAGIYGFIRLPETKPDTPRTTRAPWSETSRRRYLFPSKAFLAVVLVGMAVFFTRGTTRLTLLPLQGAAEFGLSAGQLGLILSVMAVVNLALVGPAAWLADRFGRRVAIVPSLFVAAGALVGMAAADGVVAFVAAAIALAIATGMSGPAVAAFIGDITSAESRGRAFGVYRTAGDVGLLTGPPLLGGVADAKGFSPAYLINAAVIAAGAIAFFAWGHAPRRTEPAEGSEDEEGSDDVGDGG